MRVYRDDERSWRNASVIYTPFVEGEAPWRGEAEFDLRLAAEGLARVSPWEPVVAPGFSGGIGTWTAEVEEAR